MRRLIRMATWLYPAEWRRRYGVEFQCLLDDASPRWRDLFDVLGGGLQMRLTGASTISLMIVWALIGAAPALVFSLRLPDLYRADALITATAAGSNAQARMDQIRGLAKRRFNDATLARIIETYDLYHNGARPRSFGAFARVVLDPAQQSKSMDEAVDQMRRNILLETTPPGAVLRLTFISNKPAIAAQVANQLAALMLEDSRRNAAGAESGNALRITVRDPARIPEKPFFPGRENIVALGAFAGALLGLLISLLRPTPMQLAS